PEEAGKTAACEVKALKSANFHFANRFAVTANGGRIEKMNFQRSRRPLYHGGGKLDGCLCGTDESAWALRVRKCGEGMLISGKAVQLRLNEIAIIVPESHPFDQAMHRFPVFEIASPMESHRCGGAAE
ncbi:MAG: hypothetical protein AAF989_06465, partial [Planctomycetota bacterium]